MPFSNSDLHQTQHLYFGNIALENRFGTPKFTSTNLIMSSSEAQTLPYFGMPFCACIFELESAKYEPSNTFLYKRCLFRSFFLNDNMPITNTSLNSSNCKFRISKGHTTCHSKKVESNNYKTEFEGAVFEFMDVVLHIL